MDKVDFKTDFTALCKQLLTGRNLPASHLFTRVHDSEVLGNVDEQLVKSTMKTIDQDIRRVEAAINDNKKLQEFLCSQLKDLQYKTAGYKSLLAPIRRLPVEILQDIFALVEAERRSMVHYIYNRNDQKNLPPAASQVNRHWRRIALGTPSLWAASWVVLGTKKSASQIETLKLRTQRSDPLPISLVIHTTTVHLPLWYQDAYDDEDEDEDYGYDDYYGESRRMSREDEVDELADDLSFAAGSLATQAILPVLHRLGSITILQHSSALETFLNDLEEHQEQPALPQLRSLVVPAETATGQSFPLPFSWAKNLELERLFIDSDKLKMPNRSLGTWDAIPWKSLKAFHGPLLDSQLMDVFKTTAPQLQVATFIVQNVPPLPKSDVLAKRFPLQNLTSLHLRAIKIPQSPNSLPPLPALRHLLFQPDSTESYGLILVPSGPESSGRNAKLKALILTVVRAWGSQLDYFGLDLTKISHSDSLDPNCVDEIIAATPNIEALALPSNWMTELNRVVPRLPRLSHIEMLHASYFAPRARAQAKPKDSQWSRETLSRLRTLTFCESNNMSMENAKKKAKQHRLGVVVSCQFIHPSMRFSSPYFIRQGGLFTQCLADDKAREQAVKALGNNTSYYY